MFNLSRNVTTDRPIREFVVPPKCQISHFRLDDTGNAGKQSFKNNTLNATEWEPECFVLKDEKNVFKVLKNI